VWGGFFGVALGGGFCFWWGAFVGFGVFLLVVFFFFFFLGGVWVGGVWGGVFGGVLGLVLGGVFFFWVGFLVFGVFVLGCLGFFFLFGFFWGGWVFFFFFFFFVFFFFLVCWVGCWGHGPLSTASFLIFFSTRSFQGWTVVARATLGRPPPI